MPHSMIADRIDKAAATIAGLRPFASQIERMGNVLADALMEGHKALAAGNGGSAAEAMHLCEELVGKYASARKALPAICLNADATIITCVANDWSYEDVFSRQVEAFARPGDALVVFSTSGNSANLLRAAEAMRNAGGTVLGLLGRGGGSLRGHCDHSLIVDSNDTGHIQEAHQVVLHLLLELVEKRI